MTKAEHAHIGDTVDEPFFVLRGVHRLEEAAQIRLRWMLPDYRDMDVLHPKGRDHSRFIREIAGIIQVAKLMMTS